MGASPSKTTDSPHVFAADQPIRFSESLITTLQNNPETDSSRAKNLELIIQQRVTSELQKHLAAAESKLSSLGDKLSAEPIENADGDKEGKRKAGPSLTEKPLLTRLSERITGSSGSDSSSSSTQQQGEEQAGKGGLDREKVERDLEQLRKKLNARRKIVERDEAVEKAKEEVVKCLRANDRRPLDCWEEVERFKGEVARLERGFVDRTAA